MRNVTGKIKRIPNPATLAEPNLTGADVYNAQQSARVAIFKGNNMQGKPASSLDHHASSLFR